MILATVYVLIGRRAKPHLLDVVLIITLVPKAAEQPLTTARSAGEMKA